MHHGRLTKVFHKCIISSDLIFELDDADWSLLLVSTEMLKSVKQHECKLSVYSASQLSEEDDITPDTIT